MEIIKEVLKNLSELINSLNPNISLIVKIFLLFLSITFYAVFVYFSCFVFSRKNLLDFNLMKKASQNSAVLSFFSFFLYILEYMIIIPIFVFLWFSFYSIILFLVSNNLSSNQILLISTALISSIRATSFFKEKISEDLASIVPMSFLGLILIGERSLSLNLILNKISEVRVLISFLPIYLLFIFSLEMIFRLIEAFRIFILKIE